MIGHASYQELSWKVSGRFYYVRYGRFTLCDIQKYRNDFRAIMLAIQMYFYMQFKYWFSIHGVYVRYWRLLDDQISSDQEWSTL